MLQSAPGIVFTLFAGPLTDTYGRKPLIISALFGYFLLNLVFLINAYWFFELKVNRIPDASCVTPDNAAGRVPAAGVPAGPDRGRHLLLPRLILLHGGHHHARHQDRAANEGLHEES